MTSQLSPKSTESDAIGWSEAAKAAALSALQDHAESLYEEAEREAKRRGADHVSPQFVTRAADTLAARIDDRLSAADVALQAGELFVGLAGGAALGWIAASQRPGAIAIAVVVTTGVVGLLLVTYGLSTLTARRE